MGADAKRRESRKRKFAHLRQEHVSLAQFSNGDEEIGNNLTALELPDSKAEKGNLENTDKSLVTVTSDTAAANEQPIPAEKTPRFICFIGNLPFTATTDTITKHFAKVQPSSIRHRTNKDTGKSKGFAFLEFAGYDRMKTCLQSYHHSTFEDGLSPARKINVELTAGGGGAKSKERKSKLQAKNEKLNEERKRRVEEEESKLLSERSQDTTDQSSNIHPSRRTRVFAG